MKEISATPETRQTRRSLATGRVGAALGRFWVWPAAALALASAGHFAVSYPRASVVAETASTAAQPQANTNLGSKHVVYELTGLGSGQGSVSYLDVDANNVKAEVALPWSVEFTPDNKSMAASLAAQTSGNRLRCRILVDGEERASNEVSAPNAAVSCNVMAV